MFKQYNTLIALGDLLNLKEVIMRVLLTGCAGFIGESLSRKLLSLGNQVFGLDSISSYYSVKTKKNRIKGLQDFKDFAFQQIDLSEVDLVDVFKFAQPDVVIHLAAQPGVRLRVNDYEKYTRDNLTSFSNILSVSAAHGIKAFVYASSSSVYGSQKTAYFNERESVPNPTSYYGATKLANEVLAKSLSNMNLIRSRGLRFFSVYGPQGRPDMAYSRIIGSAVHGIPFNLHGDGSIERDFTYIEDVVEAILSLTYDLLNRDSSWNDVVNIGGGKPISISRLISIVEQVSGKEVKLEKGPGYPSDVFRTCADFTYLNELIGKYQFKDIYYGIKATVNWAQSKTKFEYAEFLGQ